MYADKIKTQDEAICHLFFHCCLKDGRFTESEINSVSDLFVKAGFHGKLNFKDEIIKYRSYDTTITDDGAYIRHLLGLIKPANELALYSYCVELCLGDAELGRAGHLAVSIFIGRRTRVAASQQFDVANPARSVATVAFYELRGRVESSRAPNSRNNRAPSPRQAVPCITASVVGASRANRSSMPAVCGACAK